MEKERKVQIIKAAVKRFTKHGINKTTLDEIARDLRIGKATIYHYFSSKDELYYAAINWRTDEYIEELKKIFINDELLLEQKFLEYFTYKENIYNHFQLIYELILQLMGDAEKEKEANALIYLLKCEEELIHSVLNSLMDKKEINESQLPSFIVMQSWGLMFGNKMNLIYNKDRSINSKEMLLECCLKKILNKI